MPSCERLEESLRLSASVNRTVSHPDTKDTEERAEMNQTRGLRIIVNEAHGAAALSSLFRDIPLENYSIFLQSGMFASKTGWFNKEGVIISSTQMNREVYPNATTVEATILLFPMDSHPRRLEDYGDFLHSAAQYAVMLYDAAVVEVYVKDEASLLRMIQNLSKIPVEQYQILTDENDTRTAFL